MNAVVDQALDEPSSDLRVVSVQTNALILDQSSMNSMIRMADIMASGKVTIPAHLKNSQGDCMAVVMQAMQWGMNPFAVAQKTHLSQGGALGYEAQLISAAVVACGALKGQPDYEFIGDWSRVLGKVEERKSDKGGKYYVATYTKADEEGLGVICRATLRGESKPREVELMMSQCYPRFSTQWATDPKQQITYAAVRKFARRHAPGAILGVYTPDELDGSNPEKNMGPADVVPGSKAPSNRPELAPYPADRFERNKLNWKTEIQSGKGSSAELIGFLSTKGILSDGQKKEIQSWAKQQPMDDFDKALDASGDYTPE